MTKKRSLITTLVAGLAISSIAGMAVGPTLAQPPAAQEPASGQPPKEAQLKDAYETARLHPKLKTFVSLIDAAGLTETLHGKGPYTILAPVNDAFDRMSASTVADWKRPENKEKLVSLLQSHIIAGKYTSGDLANQEDKVVLRTIGGTPVMLTKLPRPRFNNTAGIYAPDIPVENGVIHVIDAVLVPASGADTKSMDPQWSRGTMRGGMPRPFDEPEKDRSKPTPANPTPANLDNPNRPYF